MDYNGGHRDWMEDNKTKKETHTRGFESSTLIRNLSPLLESKFNTTITTYTTTKTKTTTTNTNTIT